MNTGAGARSGERSTVLVVNKIGNIVSSILSLAIFVGGLFGSAGTWNWPEAWAFILIILVLGMVMRVRLARDNPDLLQERQRSPFQRDQATWDKVFLALFLPGYVTWLVLMGLDAVRFEWSQVPLWLEIIGGIVVCTACPVFSAIFRENAFAVPVVKLQKERGQHVITTGPYAVVRHPMYTCILIVLPAVSLLLGSFYGVIGAGFLGLLLIGRTALEDRMLQRELDGYTDYAQKVKHRLIPGVW